MNYIQSAVKMLDAEIKKLQSVRDALTHLDAFAEANQPKRRISAAGRKAIVAAQKKRWAKVLPMKKKKTA